MLARDILHRGHLILLANAARFEVCVLGHGSVGCGAHATTRVGSMLVSPFTPGARASTSPPRIGARRARKSTTGGTGRLLVAIALRDIHIAKMRTEPLIELALGHHRLFRLKIDLIKELAHVLKNFLLAPYSTGSALRVDAIFVFTGGFLLKFLSGLLSRSGETVATVRTRHSLREEILCRKGYRYRQKSDQRNQVARPYRINGAETFLHLTSPHGGHVTLGTFERGMSVHPYPPLSAESGDNLTV
jgi:hypothetical protein